MRHETESGVRGAQDWYITRVFDAPRELVYQTWTDPRHMARWWGPHAFENPICQLDVRVGGSYRIVMHNDERGDYPVQGVYREVVPPERLVMTVDVSEHPDDWFAMVNANRSKPAPATIEILQTVTFEDLGGQTRLTVTMHFADADTRDAFVKLQMSVGWSQSLEKLAKVLANK